VEAVRIAEEALGEVRLGPTEHERPNLQFRRSLFAVTDIAAGQPLTRENVRSIRPAHGLHPRHLEEVLGKRATRAIAGGTPLTWDLIS
jgi:sialic acid synthase SpsE